MLLAFEAAARTGSFTRAADELSLTQSAVSRQIRVLEELLGTVLFIRERQSVVLTEAGRSYARQIRRSLMNIGSATMSIRASPSHASFHLAVLPGFSNRWLMPRVGDFMRAHPDVTLHFSTRTTPFEFESELFDGAIHFGHADWSGTESVPLMGEVLMPLASAEFIAANPCSSAEDLLSVALLHLTSRPDAWERWFLRQGVDFGSIHGLLLDQQETVASAARAGLGVALLPEFLFRDEMVRGELRPIIDCATPGDQQYHFVWPTSARDSPTVVAFRDWIVNAARHSEAE
jgi:DNA-binding transcriptional LysR family regulator